MQLRRPIEFSELKSRTRIPLALAIVFAILTTVLTSMPLTSVQRQFVGERDKFLHVVIFSIFTFCVAWAASSWFNDLTKLLLVVGVSLTVFAAIDEAIQILVPSRTFDFKDFAANCIGIALGILIFTLVFVWRLHGRNGQMTETEDV